MLFVIDACEAIGSITELLMATGRSPDFQAAVEEWLDMFREDCDSHVGR